jgi:hypothetical protein
MAEREQQPDAEVPWPHGVEGFDALPEHLRQAVIDAPPPSAEFADELRALVPIIPPPAEAPALESAA